MSNDQGGVRVSKLAASGAASADFYHHDPQWQMQWKAVVSKIPADIYLIMLGGNDQGFGVKPEQYLKNIQGLVGMVREIQPTASINLILRQDTTRSSAYPMSAYAQVLEPWARKEHLGYANLQCAFGADFKRYAGTMIGPDKIHPLPESGGRVIADFFYRLIVGGNTGLSAQDTCRSELAPGGAPTKVVNDNARILKNCGVIGFFVGTPPGASSLLQGCRFEVLQMSEQLCGLERHQLRCTTGFHVDDDRRVVAANTHPESPVAENHFQSIAVIDFQRLPAVKPFQVSDEGIGVEHRPADVPGRGKHTDSFHQQSGAEPGLVGARQPLMAR
jgi:hypothetical protein